MYRDDQNGTFNDSTSSTLWLCTKNARFFLCSSKNFQIQKLSKYFYLNETTQKLYQVDRPATLFPKRNATRVVVRNRNSPTRATPKTTPFTTTAISTTPTQQTPRATRKTVRRKITRNPNVTTRKATTQNYEQFSDIIDDDIASVLPALTSVKPRRVSKPVVAETTTRALPKVQPNQIQTLEPKFERKPSTFDEILEQQYKIKGIDVSEENYEEDERLIGVLGSQVCAIQN